jgi:hypothetical protein
MFRKFPSSRKKCLSSSPLTGTFHTCSYPFTYRELPPFVVQSTLLTQFPAELCFSPLLIELEGVHRLKRLTEAA